MYIHICERPIEKVDLPFPIWIEDTALPGGSYAEAPLFSQRGRKTSVEIIYHGSSDSSNPLRYMFVASQKHSTQIPLLEMGSRFADPVKIRGPPQIIK